MTAAEFLDRHGWCQGAYARDKDGEIVRANDPAARSFCAEAALSMSYPNTYQFVCAFNAVQQACNDILSNWNDAPGRTKAEVVDLLRKAGV